MDVLEDKSSQHSSQTSNLSFKLKYPVFKVKQPCDGVPPRRKSHHEELNVEEEGEESIKCQEISWLASNRQFCTIVFDEKLIVCKPLDKMVGEATVRVYLSEEGDYVLHSDWELFDTEWWDVGGTSGTQIYDNTSFTSLIRKNLITVEEKYCELHQNESMENHLYVCEKGDSYEVIRTVQKDSCNICREHCEIPLSTCKDILTWGSFLLLLRQMTVLNILEIDPLRIVMPDGGIYDLIFNIDEFRCVIFDNNVKILVKKIVATIASPDTNEMFEEITTFLSENGRVVHQMWKNKRLVLRFDPRLPWKDLQRYYCKRYPHMEPPTSPPLSELWRQDIQMNSMFNQQTRVFLQEYESFYEQRPELQNILRDFLQDILISKPGCVFIFTSNFFRKYL